MLIAIKPDNFIANACLWLIFAEGESTLSTLFPEVLLIMVSLCDKVHVARKSPLLMKNLGTDPLNFQVYSNVIFSI